MSISRFYDAPDGLRLHVRDYRPHTESGLAPVVCLPGLTRSADDFGRLAHALAAHPTAPRRVLAFDYRGRGRSAHDPEWRHYTIAVEQADYLAWLDTEGIAAAHFIGTSRGGIHVMALAQTRRELIRAVVLNDIGPVLEPAGLARIKAYVGKDVSAPRDLDDAIARLQRTIGLHSDGLSRDEWLFLATTTFGDDPDHLRLRSDPNLSHALDDFDPAEPVADMWAQYDALRGAPVLAIRGGNSDLLSAETFAQMMRRWPGCEGLSVPGQGHPPLLADASSIARVADFLAAADG